MFENVIIGIDEPDADRDAIKLATERVAPGGKLTLAHIREHALSVARGLAADHRARVSVCEVVSLPACLTNGIAGPWGAIAEAFQLEAKDRLGHLEGVEPHVVPGDVGEELTLYSASTDLLILGFRDFGPVGRLVHSSTGRRLARTARCPLLILTRAGGEQIPQHLAVRPSVPAGA